ncbi:hypothetical protein B9Z55_021600 [Caenorhabditis nigoni]|uniref:F-box domain-containing protein n=1 Tax=Caenorhabditis nigoni TaxID=1611254 RepID=A0A2G5TSU2_9PELO|nr:hypothetical protein B9Z55_021600 [Caenorhabditis nigoni]
MPIPFLSLPDKDLQYALKCMDIGELVCLSLCSKRTKNLVKSSDLKIESSAKLHKNFIHLDAYPRKLHELQNHPRTISFYHYTDYWIIEKYGTNTYRYTVRREPGSTLSDWIAHFQYIFNAPIIDLFIIGNASLSNLETVKLFIPRCKKLELSDQCSDEVAKMAFRKSFLIAERVKIFKNIFDEDNGIIKYLSLNLKDVIFVNYQKPFKLTSGDLLSVNIEDLYIETAIITEKELNRFVKLWTKSKHRFYRPKFIELYLRRDIDRAELLKGFKYEPPLEDNDNSFRFKRKDGKELFLFMEGRLFERDTVIFEFRG